VEFGTYFVSSVTIELAEAMLKLEFDPEVG